MSTGSQQSSNSNPRHKRPHHPGSIEHENGDKRTTKRYRAEEQQELVETVEALQNRILALEEIATKHYAFRTPSQPPTLANS
jgi:hypothetical protein